MVRIHFSVMKHCVRRAFSCAMVFVLVGCVTSQSQVPPKLEIEQGAKVGVYVSLNEMIAHFHSKPIYNRIKRQNFETTAAGPSRRFTGYSVKQLDTVPAKFDFYHYAVSVAHELLKERGYEGVELNASALNEAGFVLSDFYSDSRSQRTIAQKLGLSGIIAIESAEQEFNIPCYSIVPCERILSTSPLLWTFDSSRRDVSYRVHLPLNNSLFVFGQSAPIYLQKTASIKELESYKEASFEGADVRHLSDKDWAVINADFKALILENLQSSVSSLVPPTN